MSTLKKYNICRGVSTLLCVGTPITVAAINGQLLVDRPSKAISLTGIIAILLVGLFCKDKLLEQLKTPTVAKVCLAIWLCIQLFRNIIEPIEQIVFYTFIVAFVDELTLKRMYNNYKTLLLANNIIKTEYFGFIFSLLSKEEVTV